MAEGGLKREYFHAPLQSMCGMAVPQLVWVSMEACYSSAVPTNISNRLSRNMSLSAFARKYVAVNFAEAKSKKLERDIGTLFRDSLNASTPPPWKLGIN